MPKDLESFREAVGGTKGFGGGEGQSATQEQVSI